MMRFLCGAEVQGICRQYTRMSLSSLVQIDSWLRSSTHSKRDCSIGLSDFASSVIEYSKPYSEFVNCVRETSPCSSSSFSRRAMVVEDESTSFFNSENRAGFFFLSKIINVCNDFDLVKSDSNSSTRPQVGLHFFSILLNHARLYLFFSCNKNVTTRIIKSHAQRYSCGVKRFFLR